MTEREEIQARLGEIRARAESATIGPWRVLDRPAELNGRDHVGVEAPHVERWNVVALTGHTGAHPMNVPDAEFIAHARDDVPFLLAEVHRLWSALVQEQMSSRAAWQNLNQHEDDMTELIRALGLVPEEHQIETVLEHIGKVRAELDAVRALDGDR